MSYFSEWNQNIEATGENGQLSDYAKEYYALESAAYRNILAAYPDKKWAAPAAELAEELGFAEKMDIFLGFLDGIHSSLREKIDLDSVDDASEIKLDIDYEKLFWNMHEASAKWLYDLEEWEQVLPEEKRQQLTRDFNREHIAVSRKIGRNDPCPCGSGKKYKQCCLRKDQTTQD